MGDGGPCRDRAVTGDFQTKWAGRISRGEHVRERLSFSISSAAGLLSGAPAAFGTFNFTARVTDANGCQAAARRKFGLRLSFYSGNAVRL